MQDTSASVNTPQAAVAAANKWKSYAKSSQQSSSNVFS
jgi:hypothetical protein